MEYSLEMQEVIDIDWYALDDEGVIMHFASGGGELPQTVSGYKEDTDKLAEFFRSLPINEIKVFINPQIDKIVEFNSNKERERYLQDFISMSKRGLYSYDKTIPSNFSHKEYHLVSYPEKLLLLDSIPKDIRNVLNRTIIPMSVTETRVFSIYDIGPEKTR